MCGTKIHSTKSPLSVLYKHLVFFALSCLVEFFMQVVSTEFFFRAFQLLVLLKFKLYGRRSLAVVSISRRAMLLQTYA